MTDMLGWLADGRARFNVPPNTGRIGDGFYGSRHWRKIGS